jgi:hypothetical protein
LCGPPIGLDPFNAFVLFTLLLLLLSLQLRQHLIILIDVQVMSHYYLPRLGIIIYRFRLVVTLLACFFFVFDFVRLGL